MHDGGHGFSSTPTTRIAPLATLDHLCLDVGIADMDSVLSTMQGARSSTGETLNRLDGAENRISMNKLTAQTERSNAEDLDMTSAISDFQAKQNGYQAALQSYSMVQKMSLFQYLNT
jgi:flagellar hook-associated protein 3 FlgL